MDIRRSYEELEENILSPFAALSKNSKGRKRQEEKCSIRTDFQRDRDRIIHSNSFRRLKHKTQVFLSPEGDHYRTRLTHTLEVSQIARTISRALRLNEDLTEAAALGHDLGHTPFGHAGEEVLNDVMKKQGGFTHANQSVRVVEVLENDGAGLNLTAEVIDGILKHSDFSAKNLTLEGKIVRLADKIAYINHDIDDAVRGGILTADEIPKSLRDILGDTKSERINTLIVDIIKNSTGKDSIEQSKEVGEAMQKLRRFMFKKVYLNPAAKSEEKQAKKLVRGLYDYYYKNPDKLPEKFSHYAEREGVVRAVCDYIAGMTDRFAVKSYYNVFIPKSWQIL